MIATACAHWNTQLYGAKSEWQITCLGSIGGNIQRSSEVFAMPTVASWYSRSNRPAERNAASLRNLVDSG